MVNLLLPTINVNCQWIEISFIKIGTGSSPLKVCDNEIQNLSDCWLNSKIPDFILEIPIRQIRKAYVMWLVIYGKWHN